MGQGGWHGSEGLSKLLLRCWACVYHRSDNFCVQTRVGCHGRGLHGGCRPTVKCPAGGNKATASRAATDPPSTVCPLSTHAHAHRAQDWIAGTRPAAVSTGETPVVRLRASMSSRASSAGGGAAASGAAATVAACCVLPFLCLGMLCQGLALTAIGAVKGLVVVIPVAAITVPTWILATILHWPAAVLNAMATLAVTQRLGTRCGGGGGGGGGGRGKSGGGGDGERAAAGGAMGMLGWVLRQPVGQPVRKPGSDACPVGLLYSGLVRCGSSQRRSVCMRVTVCDSVGRQQAHVVGEAACGWAACLRASADAVPA